jgi:hypothetical protein
MTMAKFDYVVTFPADCEKFAGDPAGRNAFLFFLLRLRLIALYFPVSPYSVIWGLYICLEKTKSQCFIAG